MFHIIRLHKGTPGFGFGLFSSVFIFLIRKSGEFQNISLKILWKYFEEKKDTDVLFKKIFDSHLRRTRVKTPWFQGTAWFFIPHIHINFRKNRRKQLESRSMVDVMWNTTRSQSNLIMCVTLWIHIVSDQRLNEGYTLHPSVVCSIFSEATAWICYMWLDLCLMETK